MIKKYNDVFCRQESEGIIDRIKVNPSKFSNYNWIPHRPVIKFDTQVTTKIRPVFNCSLKNKGSCSLNEAAYPEMNLLSDMLRLLLLFKTNKYVKLADIRKAFLMIRLNSKKDKNRFCFFLKEGDELLCFRYTTLIFRFNASSFILNFVLKYHAERFPKDSCTDMLLNNFYVGNLSKISNSVEEMISLYTEVVERLKLGNFDLRSCNSNCEQLKKLIIKDNRTADHDCEFENVLGYKYNPNRDTLHISIKEVLQEANTKRKILAQSSKVFDPLSQCLPVTVRSKILIRLWSLNLGWNETITVEDFLKMV